MKKLITVIAATAAFSVMAEDIAAGWRERAFIDTPTDTTQSGVLATAPEGRLYKTGAGTLTIPESQIDRTSDFRLGVLEGKVKIVDDGTAYADYGASAPADVMSKAAFWVNAGSAQQDGSGGVSMWNDVRESTYDSSVEGSAHDHVYAAPIWDSTRQDATLYGQNPVAKNVNGYDGVYFGGFNSSQAMRWKSTDDTDNNMSGIRHLFAVFSVESGKWSPPVQAMNSPDLQGGASWDGSWYWPIHASSIGESPAMHDDTIVFIDGARIDPTVKPMENYGNGIRLIEYDFYGQTGCHAGNFYCDRGVEKRFGGDTLHEMVCFTESLSEADLEAVRRYFAEKYSKTVVAQRTKTATENDNTLVATGRLDATFAVASGAELELASEDDTTTAALKTRTILSGDGTVRKTGSGAVLVASDGTFRGDVKVDSGTVVRRGQVTFGLESGDTISSVAIDTANIGGPVGKFGDEVTVSANSAEQGTVVKTGNGEIAVAAIPDSVTKLTVADGTLVLVAPQSDHMTSGGAAVVNVPNASFEDGMFGADGTPNAKESLFNEIWDGVHWPNNINPKYGTTWPTTPYTWVFEALEDGYHDNSWIFRPSNNMSWAGGERNPRANIVPDGECALLLKAKYRAWTKVEIPLAGRYEVSFWAVGRNEDPVGLEVLFGPDSDNADSAAHLGYCFPAANAYQKFRYVTTVQEAGTYILAIQEAFGTNAADHAQTVDFFAVTRIPEKAESGVWMIPGGDFENAASYMDFDNPGVNALTDWVINDGESTPSENGFRAIEPIFPGYYAGCAWWTFNRLYGYKVFGNDGSVQLSFWGRYSGNTATASLTFTPPAGTWKLRAKAMRWYGTGSSRGNYDGVGAMEATIAVGSEEGAQSFGTASISQMMPLDTVWPVAVTFDGNTSVTLTLRQTVENACVIVDDFVLVDAAIADGELMPDGGFALGKWTGTPWTFTKGEYGGAVSWRNYSDFGTQTYYCNDPVEGYQCINISDNGIATSSISIPEDGIYRLSYWTSSRYDAPWSSFAYTGRNPIRIWLKDGNDTMTVLDESEVTSTNFVERTRLVSLSAGDYTVGIEGMNDRSVVKDRNSCVDKVSLTRYVEADFKDTPDTSEDLDIVVASGAKLRLDFAGTNQVRNVIYNGHRKSGLISAETHPEFVEGPGVLKTKKYGFTVIVR